jgi:uncharacterized protein with NAD-binding domain and iron-sulfur cluster
VSELPSYVPRGGELVFRHPVALSGCTLRGFWLDAERAKLAALVDRLLNQPAGGAVRYTPLADRVALIFADIARAGSVDPVDRGVGWMPEIDVGLWIPLLAVGGGRPRVVWLQPYLFVDSPYAMAMGRETFGFAKTIARFSWPRGAMPEAGPLVVHGLAATAFTPDTEWREAEILRVERTAAGAGSVWASAGEAAASLAGQLVGRVAGELGAELAALDLPGTDLDDRLRRLLTPGLGMVFLKQFRDVSDPAAACHQAIVEAPARLTAFRAAGVLGGRFRVDLAELASHPIAAELGLRASQSSDLAFHADFDFTMEAGRAVWKAEAAAPAPARRGPRQKVAVLGGGMGALSTVFHLTAQPGWQDRYDITVYQLGWRLGGKGASGRNAERHQRIEEHGLHILLGFYENAFALMRATYGELGRVPGAPLATWQDAFKPERSLTLMEESSEGWTPWVFDLPPRPGTPGDGTEYLMPVDYAQRLVELLRRAIAELATLLPGALDRVPLVGLLPRWLDARLRGAAGRLSNHVLVSMMLDRAQALLREWLGAATGERGEIDAAFADLVGRVAGFTEELVVRAVRGNSRLRRAYVVIDLITASLRGMVVDQILTRGFSVIDGEDWAAWARRHGAHDSSLGSPVVRGVYQLCFAFPAGDTRRPRLAAGVALRGFLRMLFDYKEAIFWKMQAGMGDVVFAPMYEVLRRRGVAFRFFHKVERLRLSADGTAIAAIDVEEQVTLKDPAAGYDPLVDVGGLPSWPSAPRLDQLVEGDELGRRGVDLECHWTDWRGARRTLELGRDFDQVVLGVPVGALPSLTAELAAASPRWARMLREVGTVATLAMQLWWTRDVAGLGWPLRPPVLDGYIDPFNTWADMGHLLDHEPWPAPAPRALAYLCGPLEDGPPPPVGADPAYPVRRRAEVVDCAVRWLGEAAGGLWPRAVSAAGFDGRLLHGAAGATLREQLASQYCRANVNPSDRYVLSEPGTIEARLPAGDSGFSNLVLAGDWTRTGLDAGCLEAAVMSGMQASRALSGWPERVVGETDFPA